MKISIRYFSNLTGIVSHTQGLRENGTDDVVIVTKKSDASVGLAVSGDFLDTNLNQEYIAQHNVEIARSQVNYGAYGNVLSIPGVTFTVVIPMETKEQFSKEYVEAAYVRLFGGADKVSKEGNDFTLGGRKCLGTAIFQDCGQHVAIGCLSRVGEDIDGFYSPAWREGGKALPSKRIEGYREATGDENATIEDFAQALKFRMNEQLKGTVTEIEVIEMEGGEGDD